MKNINDRNIYKFGPQNKNMEEEIKRLKLKQAFDDAEFNFELKLPRPPQVFNVSSYVPQGTVPPDVPPTSRLYAWGWAFRGRLGNNVSTNTNFLTPVSVQTAGTPMEEKIITEISSIRDHNLVVGPEGQVYSWGNNLFRQLGDGTTTDRSVPVATMGFPSALAGKTIVQVAAAENHSLALASDNTMIAWGNNQFGQLGFPTGATSNPVQVATAGTPLSGKTIVQVAAGGAHNLVLASDGTVYSWGNNEFNQLGDGTATNRSSPVSVVTAGTPMAGKTIVKVAAGVLHSCAIDSNGQVYSWGNNLFRQLGDGTTTDRSTPVAVITAGTPMANKVIVDVSSHFHSLALASDETMYSWGWNGSGRLGDGTTTHRTTPVAVTTAGTPLAGKTVVQISAGSASLALTSDNMLFSWGPGGLVGDGTNTARTTPVAVQVLGTPLEGDTVLKIVASDSHMLVLGGF